MIKTILVPVEQSDFSTAAVRFALEVASEHDAEVSLMAVVDKPDIEKSLGPVPLGGLYYAMRAEREKLSEAEAEATELVEAFAKQCEKKKVPHHLIVREGQPVEVITDEAKYHDLTIMGLRTRFKYGAEEDDDALEGYLSHSEQPVVAIPKEYKAIKKILVAYDGSLPSARAVHSFLQLNLWSDREIVILNVGDDKDAGDVLLERIGRLFKTHDVSYTTAHEYGDPHEVLLKFAREKKADLIVLGAHGKDKITKFLFGSTTQSILDNAEVPLFIDH